MSKLLKKHASFFQLLSTTTSKLQKKVLLDTITQDQLKALTEITINLLKGNIPVTPIYKSKLKRYKKLYFLIANSSVSAKTKKRALCRQGQAISLLLKSVETVLKKFLS